METEIEKRRRTTEDLSDDLMVKILCFLPLSSIIQCLDVCKRWQTLITHGPFFPVNVAASPYYRPNCRYICLERLQKGGMEISNLDFSVDFPNKHLYEYRILSSCNGLLFSYYFLEGKSVVYDGCYISNPWTKEYVRLPNPSPTRCSQISSCGLAFENNSRDDNNVALYKIVMAHKNYGSYLYNYEFEIYSSDKKRWRLLKWASKPHHCYQGDLDPSAVYCNRALYWQCPRMDHALVFNLETETSYYLNMPRDHDDNAALYNCKLTECDGQLHYIRIGSASCHRLIVWRMSMTSGGWLILHNVDFKGIPERNMDFFPMWREESCFPNFKPIDMSCQGNDKVLFADHFNQIESYDRIVSFDLKKGAFELVLEGPQIQEWEFFRYSPTNKCISERSKPNGKGLY